MKTDILNEEIFADASSLTKVGTQEGKELSGLVGQLNSVMEQINETEEHLKQLKSEKQRLSIEIIPQKMDEMGMERVDVEGASVTLEPFVSASIPKDRREEAFSWLRENGLDDIIKNDVTVSFSAGQDNQAGAVVDDLRQQGLDPAQKTHIHAQTLKKWVGDRLKDGKETDFDTFGVYVGTEAKITRS